MTLKYTISNQAILPIECPDRIVVEQSRNFVYLDLSFDTEWDGLSIVVLFENDASPGRYVQALWRGEPVAIPQECLVTGQLRIGCVGVSGSGEKRLTTRRMARGIPVFRCGGVIGAPPQEETPLLEQIIAALGSLADLKTEDKSSLVAAINEVLSKAGSGGGAALPAYTGAYTVTPQAYMEQTLKTKSKSMTDDVTVEEIPIYETSNEYGTTINIGG